VLVLYQLPDDYYDQYRERIRAITADQILAAAQQHLHPDALQMVVVGDAAAVRSSLETLGFSRAMTYDSAGQVLA